MTYDESEKRFQPFEHNRTCIDRTVTNTGKCAGYCDYEGHPGYLTQKHIHKKNCIAKGCDYFRKKTGRKYGCGNEPYDPRFAKLAALKEQLAE